MLISSNIYEKIYQIAVDSKNDLTFVIIYRQVRTSSGVAESLSLRLSGFLNYLERQTEYKMGTPQNCTFGDWYPVFICEETELNDG